jgi:cytoplasmic iron level regulating protein YaaA (DUF328/UPF0246 family)
MITIISPAKTLDLNAVDIKLSTHPEFKKEIKELVGIMKKKPKTEIQRLMGVSENLATLNKERYRNFEDNFTPENSKPALFAFKGDVYRKMDVENYSKDQLDFAQEHVRILSGLYGLLKPLDLIQPYRLEMGLKFKTKKSKDLYGYWENKITKAIDASATDGIVINLASQEYFKAVNKKKLKSKVINISFKEYREGAYKVIGIFAKQARGIMANFIIENKIDDPEKLKMFNEDDYEYSEKYSSRQDWVFIR